MLDFDFEKVCSVSLSNLNVYACLVCGKYFQGKNDKLYSFQSISILTYLACLYFCSLLGRGRQSHAYFHSLHEDHHVFINLHTLKVRTLIEINIQFIEITFLILCYQFLNPNRYTFYLMDMKSRIHH